MMAAAVEIVSFQAQREKEAELIFRGQQYVEGIRLYRQKYGRLPMRMKELWEADPRVLRQKWTDPITGDEKWGVIFEGQQGQPHLCVKGIGQRQTEIPKAKSGQHGDGDARNQRDQNQRLDHTSVAILERDQDGDDGNHSDENGLSKLFYVGAGGDGYAEQIATAADAELTIDGFDEWEQLL